MLNIIFFGFKLKSMTMTTIIAGPWKIYCWWGFLSAVGQRVLVSFSFSSREDLALPKRLSRDLSLKLKIFISSQFSNLFEISFFFNFIGFGSSPALNLFGPRCELMPLGRWGFFLDPGSFPNPRCGFEGALIGLMGLLEERLLAASEYFLTSARSLWDVGDPGGLIRYAYLCIFFWVCLKINGKSFLYAKNRFAYFSLFSLIYAKLKAILTQEIF